MKDTYEVVPVYQKRWFREGRVVYNLIRNYRYWDDPSYGNGGGDYRDAQQVIHTFRVLQDAIDTMNTLNKAYK